MRSKADETFVIVGTSVLFCKKILCFANKSNGKTAVVSITAKNTSACFVGNNFFVTNSI